ncbi:glutathione S-transferase [Grimontia sp. AD028]|uniref:glutathione S-transferase family protein n=1 Tax=Grimontia sp. AD028 TaxID=1581149 RepID=UPI00061B0D6A|nr:glutathione S-transferase family protein [Grimontia sp. AD028]KKD61703.1 glutathione S-transferase [Grimontia sp. AD028]
MYTLYYLPDACSLATQTVLLELGQTVEIINKQSVKDYESINPVGDVPVLVENGIARREGAAILLHLLEKHPNKMMPTEGLEKERAVENILFANATMHPAYGRLFFIANNIHEDAAKRAAYEAAAGAINHLWNVVEQQLEDQDFLGGAHPSAADIMLTVYSRWGGSFPVDIQMGPKTQKMVEAVLALPSFQQALTNEQRQSAA